MTDRQLLKQYTTHTVCVFAIYLKRCRFLNHKLTNTALPRLFLSQTSDLLHRKSVLKQKIRLDSHHIAIINSFLVIGQQSLNTINFMYRPTCTCTTLNQMLFGFFRKQPNIHKSSQRVIAWVRHNKPERLSSSKLKCTCITQSKRG